MFGLPDEPSSIVGSKSRAPKVVHAAPPAKARSLADRSVRWRYILWLIFDPQGYVDNAGKVAPPVPKWATPRPAALESGFGGRAGGHQQRHGLYHVQVQTPKAASGPTAAAAVRSSPRNTTRRNTRGTTTTARGRGLPASSTRLLAATRPPLCPPRPFPLYGEMTSPPPRLRHRRGLPGASETISDASSWRYGGPFDPPGTPPSSRTTGAVTWKATTGLHENAWTLANDVTARRGGGPSGTDPPPPAGPTRTTRWTTWAT